MMCEADTIPTRKQKMHNSLEKWTQHLQQEVEVVTSLHRQPHWRMTSLELITYFIPGSRVLVEINRNATKQRNIVILSKSKI